jgi:hypothetical protein
MAISREEAIRLATAFANANGYRVVPNFHRVAWVYNPLPVKFDAVRWIDDHWSVLFDKLLHPDVESECPSDICVQVDDKGRCSFFALL